MNLSITIQTHPKRAELTAALVEQLGCLATVDPAPSQSPSPWRTYRHALETTPPDATHRLILQDDVTVCDGFLPAVHAAVEARPERLLLFFVGGNPWNHARAIYAAADQDWSWAELDNNRWVSAIAVCWPVGLITPFLEYVDAQNWPPSFRADDEIIGRYCRARGIHPLASVPSLVEHMDEVPSLIGRRAAAGRDRGRVAACWIGDCDPASIDWNIGP